MIGKISKGISFRGVLDYLEAKVTKNQGIRLCGNMYGENARQLATEFGISRSLRPNLSKAVFHVSLNLAPGETATNEDFLKMADTYLDEMGFNDCQFVAYRHFDRDHHHIHLVISKISLAGDVVSDKSDFARSEKVMRKLENEFGLSQVIDSAQAKNKQLSKGQIERYRRTGEVPIKVQLQQILTLATSGKPSLNEFTNELASYGVNVNFHHSNSKVFGISYELEGVAFKGSSLGKGYTWNNIKQQINYEHERDFEFVCKTSVARTQENTRRPSGKASKNELYEHQRTQGSTIAHTRIDKESGTRSSGRGFKPESNNPELESYVEKHSPITFEAGGYSSGYERGAETNNMESSSNWFPIIASSQYSNRNRDDDEDLDLRKIKKKKKRGPSQDMGHSL